MKNMFALLAVAMTAWAFSPSAHANDESLSAFGDDASAIVNPGWGGGHGPGGPGFGGGHGPGGPGFGGPGHGPGGFPGGPGHGPGGPGPGGPGFPPPGGPGHGGPGFPPPGGPGHGGPGFPPPGGPGWGPGHGGPGWNPGHGGWTPRPGHGGWTNPGWGHPGWNHPGHPGWGAHPGWRPGWGVGRPGWNPGWGSGHWAHPGWWHVPHHGWGWYPPVFMPLPPPPPGIGEFLCYGNFVGVFGTDRDAYLSMNTENYDVDGQMTIEDPEMTYNVDGSCEQVGEAADVRINLNGGEYYVGQIYRADDGQVYFEGTQPSTGIRFVFQRQSY